MSKSCNSKCFNPRGSHSNNFCDFASRHSEQIASEDLTKNFVILNLFQNLKIFGLFRIAFESINFNHNQTDRFRNKFGMTNFVYFHHSFCYSERSEESPDLSELDRTHSLVREAG